jgi:hypothetical protein
MGAARGRGIKLVEYTALNSIARILACLLSGTSPSCHHAGSLHWQEVKVLLQILPLIIAVVGTIRLGGRHATIGTSAAGSNGALGAIGVGSANRAGGGSCSRVAAITAQAHCRSKTKE